MKFFLRKFDRETVVPNLWNFTVKKRSLFKNQPLCPLEVLRDFQWVISIYSPPVKAQYKTERTRGNLQLEVTNDVAMKNIKTNFIGCSSRGG